MEQQSDVEYRAEKQYKNSREKFGYLLREVVSNSIHAVIIKSQSDTATDYLPFVKIRISSKENHYEITVIDNGDGFNKQNRKYFTHLDTKNIQKERLNFHPMGQGRLAIVFFSDRANYSSIYIDEDNNYKQRSFEYPEKSATLFDIENLKGTQAIEHKTGTTLKLIINKQQTYSRAKTFFAKYSDAIKIRDWFIENFFPFFIEYENLELQIDFDSNIEIINHSFIEKNIESIKFTVDFENLTGGSKCFKVWLIEKKDKSKNRGKVECFARHLQAELDGIKLVYDIDLPTAYDWLLTSEYFDDNVDQKGDKIEIDDEKIEKIQKFLNEALDNHFKNEIESNKQKTKKNIRDTKNKFHSLSPFINGIDESEKKKILTESDIINSAVDEKSKIEKSYWSNNGMNEDDIGKLLNSSLHIYIDHRSKILSRFQELIRRFDNDGLAKNEPEEEVHDLFLRRGKTLKDTTDTNHLHNLWILDDKYTIFSETFGASSSKKGQRASDIYMWADDQNKVRELLILELKSTSVAHNAGSKEESMVGQVRRYASDFYKDPQKILNWDINPDKVLYSGVILARKSDINKELNSNNSGTSHKIPFLESSYYFNENFSTQKNITATPTFKDIRIEMYSYEDIYELAQARNNIFFRLLKNEYSIVNEAE